MAYRKKAEAILAHEPDIVVVPECENRDKLKFKPGIAAPNDIVWFGTNANKGLGVFSYSGWTFNVLDVHNEHLQLIVTIEVTRKNTSFLLFAVWENNPTDTDGHYVEQVWKAIHCYDHLFSRKKIILAG